MKINPLFFTILSFYLGPIVITAQQDASDYLAKGDQLMKEKAYDESKLLYNKAVAAYMARSEWDSMNMVYSSIANVFFKQRDYKGAAIELQKPVALFVDQELEPTFSMAKIYLQRAFVNNRNRKLAEALADYESATDIYERLNTNHKDVAYAYNHMAMITMQRQDYSKTLHYLKSALDSDSTGRYNASIYSQLANCYLHKPDFEQSLKYFQLGLDVYQQKKAEDRKPHRLGLLYAYGAEAYFGKGDLANAERLNQKALATYPKIPKYWFYRMKRFLSLAKISYKLGKEELGLSYLNRAEEEKKSVSTAKNRDLADFYYATAQFQFEAKAYNEALQYAQKTFQQIFPDFNEDDLLINPSVNSVYPEPWIGTVGNLKGEILLTLYRETKELKYLKAAADCYELVISGQTVQKKEFDSEASKLYLGSYAHPYIEQAIEVYFQLYQRSGELAELDRIFELMEFSKASVLKEAIQKNKAILHSAIPDSLLQREREWRLQIADIQKSRALEQLKEVEKDSLRLEKLEGELVEEETGYANFLQSMKKNYPAFESAIEAVAKPSVSDVQSFLKKQDGILLEYFEGRDVVYLFSINAEDRQVFKVEKTDVLHEQVNHFLDYFSEASKITNDPDGYLKMASELYETLFPEGWTKLENAKQLILIPDGILKYLPFETLVQDNSERAIHLANAPYLLHAYTTQYAYSTALLLFENQGTKRNQRFLKVAPGFLQQERGLLPLIHSEEEFDLLKSHTALLGNKANAKRFRQAASKSNVIHLSTHATASPNRNDARIELIDTAIYLPEIYALNLDADLVVLSACESGMGKMERGEGVMSLGRAFRYAGASSVIASLWKVNEASTATIFTNFYRGLSEGMGRASALQQAKINYLNNAQSDLQQSPYYWSGFVYFGKDEALDIRSTSTSWLGGLMLVVLGLGFWWKYRF